MWIVSLFITNGRSESTIPREERVQQREIDPSAYSLSSNSKLVSESFDETNEIQSWTGGNTDFSDLGQDEPLVKLSQKNEERMLN